MGEKKHFNALCLNIFSFCVQELVSDNLIGHTQPVFQFFCPLDKLLNEEEDEGGVWGLLSGLAYFLTPGQDEEEVEFHTSPFLQVDIFKESVPLIRLYSASYLLKSMNVLTLQNTTSQMIKGFK